MGAGASAGGFYLSEMLSFDSTLPHSLDEFEKEDALEGCVKGLFPGLNDMKVIEDASLSKDEIKSNFFNNGHKDKVEGCLVINWNKENFGDKWKGNFRLMWSARHSSSNKGFVVFAVAEPLKGKKLKWTGAAYALERPKDKNEWKINKKLGIDAKGKEVEFKDKFPTSKLTTNVNWGFLNGEGDMDKLCGESDCQEDKNKKSEFFEGYWSWEGSNSSKAKSKKFGEWTDKLSKWWKEAFGDDKWKMEDVVKNMNGEWSEKVWSGIEKLK